MSISARPVKSNCAWPGDSLPLLQSILGATGCDAWEVYNPYNICANGVPAYAANHEQKLVIANWRRLWRVGSCMSDWDGYVPVLLSRAQSTDVSKAAEYVHTEALRAADNPEARTLHWQHRAALTRESHLAYLASLKQERREKRENSRLRTESIPDIDKDTSTILNVLCRRSGNSLLAAASGIFRYNIKHSNNLQWCKYALFADNVCIDPAKPLCSIRFLACRPEDLSDDQRASVLKWQSDRNILRWIPVYGNWEEQAFMELAQIFSGVLTG